MLPRLADPTAHRREGGELPARGGLEESTAPPCAPQRPDCGLGGIVISAGARQTGAFHLHAGIPRESRCRALEGRASRVELPEPDLGVDRVGEAKGTEGVHSARPAVILFGLRVLMQVLI